MVMYRYRIEVSAQVPTIVLLYDLTIFKIKLILITVFKNMPYNTFRTKVGGFENWVR